MTGGRPEKIISNRNSPALINLLKLFGLSSWDDSSEWTINDLKKNNVLLE